MTEKPFTKLIDDLKAISTRYDTVRTHFGRVFMQAEALAQHPDSPMKGQGLKAKMDAGSILIDFLDRRIRISMRYDRKTGKGVLHADDESAVRPGRPPETFARIEFTGKGDTDLLGEEDDKMTLSEPADCMLLVVRLIDAALDRDPWKQGPISKSAP